MRFFCTSADYMRTLELLLYRFLVTTFTVHMSSVILNILYVLYLHFVAIAIAPNPLVVDNKSLSYSPIDFPSSYHPIPLFGPLI